MTNEEAIELLSNYFSWCPDCIDKEHAEGYSRDCSKCMCKATEKAIIAVKNQSKIVYCRECKYSHMTESGDCKYCDIHSPDSPVYFPGDYFCADGER